MSNPMLTGLGSLMRKGDARFELPPIANPNGPGKFTPQATKPLTVKIETETAIVAVDSSDDEEEEEEVKDVDQSVGFVYSLAALAVSVGSKNHDISGEEYVRSQVQPSTFKVQSPFKQSAELIHSSYPH